MGHHLSKSESSNIKPTSSSSQKKYNCNYDDLSSRATETTDESFSAPSSPGTMTSRYHQQQPHKHHQRWRDGADNTIPPYNGVRAPSSSALVPRHNISIQRRDSDPGRPASGAVTNNPLLKQGHQEQYTQRTVPVKCPPRKTQSVCAAHDVNHRELAVASPDAIDTSYLQRMYDSRTWEMYRRITEARRQSNYSTKLKNGGPGAMLSSRAPGSIDVHAYQHEDTSEWEHLQHEGEFSPQEEQHHEMIFLFDF